MAPQAREMLDGPRSTFQVGEVLAKTFSIWLGNLVPFVILALIIFSPLYLWTFMTLQGESLTEKSLQTWQIGLSLATIVLPQVLTGAVTYGVIQQMRGRKADLGSCISVGFSRLLPVLGVGLVAGLFITLGMLLLFVPGFILLCRYAAAVPVAVIEKPGVMASLERSKQLTNGSKWPIFVVLIVFIILGVAMDYLLKHALGAADSVGHLRTYAWATLASSSLLQGPLSAVASAVIYHELRRSHEGASIEDIAKVFD